jgi:ferredoxin-NADP reductase
MPISTIQGVIESKDEVAKNTFSIKVANSQGGVFDFLPGQFVTLNIAPTVKRSYSIASLPGKAYLELIADTWKGGPGSQFFLNCKPGDKIEFMGPVGNFVYHDDPKPAYFFGTGTGLVPFMSMIESALTIEKTQRQVTLYAGFRYLEDVFCKELLELMDVEHENFIYQLCLSQPSEGWTGAVGRITQYLDSLPGNNIDAYICGSPQMVADISAQLIAKGVPETQIFHEMF